MKFKTNCKPSLAFMDITPLVDVVFLLIIFFLLSTSFDFQPGHPVALPREEDPQLVMADKLVVVISPSGENGKFSLLFNNEPHDWKQLEGQIADVVYNKRRKVDEVERPPVMALRADKSVPYEYIMRVVVISQKLGLNLNLVTSTFEEVEERADNAE